MTVFLKPCPFCDSSGIYTKDFYCTYEGELATCSNIDCIISDTEWEPSWWNTRAVLNSGRVEELENDISVIIGMLSELRVDVYKKNEMAYEYGLEVYNKIQR